MKRVLTFLFLLSFTTGFAQMNGAEEGDFVVGYSIAPVQDGNHQLTVDYFFHPNWSLFYRAGLNYSERSGSPPDIYLPVGATTSVAMLAGTSCLYASGCGSGFGLDLITLATAIPDGISYHYFPSSRIDIAPYILLSGLAVRNTPEGESQFYYSPAAGIRLQYKCVGPLRITAEQQFRRQHTGLIGQYTSFGLAVGF